MIDVAYINLVKKAIVELTTLNSVQFKAADVNGNITMEYINMDSDKLITATDVANIFVLLK